MLVIVGAIVVIACVLGGFMWAGGHVHSLLHPSEVLTIGGATIGALIMMSSKKIIIDLIKGILAALKGSPYNRALYADLFKVSYDLLRTGRRDGLLSLESHINDPHHSTLINKYPVFSKNHHAVQFLCDGLSPIVEGSSNAETLSKLIDSELKVIEEEHHAPLGVLQKSADALPGFGIVAAVLGIVITMGAIDGPVEEIGHKVGAALVGTFLGILASYGFFGPLATKMEFMGHDEMAFFHTIKAIVLGFADENSPKTVLEQARRGVGTEVRPTRVEMEQFFKEVDGAA